MISWEKVKGKFSCVFCDISLSGYIKFDCFYISAIYLLTMVIPYLV